MGTSAPFPLSSRFLSICRSSFSFFSFFSFLSSHLISAQISAQICSTALHCKQQQDNGKTKRKEMERNMFLRNEERETRNEKRETSRNEIAVCCFRIGFSERIVGPLLAPCVVRCALMKFALMNECRNRSMVGGLACVSSLRGFAGTMLDGDGDGDVECRMSMSSSMWSTRVANLTFVSSAYNARQGKASKQQATSNGLVGKHCITFYSIAVPL